MVVPWMTSPLFRQSVCFVKPWTVPAEYASPEQPYMLPL